jgi:beta-glucosidase-like glycosyl hydrolase
MTDLVRGRLGFDGLLVSDDLGMKAVADRFPIEQLVVEGLAAGLDHFILRGPIERSRQPGRHWCGRWKPARHCWPGYERV